MQERIDWLEQQISRIVVRSSTCGGPGATRFFIVDTESDLSSLSANEGYTAFVKDTDKYYYYDGDSWEEDVSRLTPSSIQLTNEAGTSARKAPIDHKHGMEDRFSDDNPENTGTTASPGTGEEWSRDDHVHVACYGNYSGS